MENFQHTSGTSVCSRLTNSKLKRVMHLAQEMALLTVGEADIKKKKRLNMPTDFFNLLF